MLNLKEKTVKDNSEVFAELCYVILLTIKKIKGI